MTSLELLPENFRTRIYGFVTAHLLEARNEMASGHAPRCVLCGTPEVSVGAGAVTGFVEGHEHRGGDDIDVIRVGITVECEFGEIVCWRGESTTLGRLAEIPHPITTREWDISVSKFQVPRVNQLLNTTIHEHHIRYEPEITVELCGDCHRTVHMVDGELDGLRPEMKRTEWEQ